MTDWEREVRWNHFCRDPHCSPFRDVRRWRIRCMVLAVVAILEFAIIAMLVFTTRVLS